MRLIIIASFLFPSFLLLTSCDETTTDAGTEVVPESALILDGTFVGVEQGDYFHLNVADAEGNERSFFVLQGDPSFDPFFSTPDQYVGKQVRVYWKKSVEEIPEAGGKMEIESASKIELKE